MEKLGQNISQQYLGAVSNHLLIFIAAFYKFLSMIMDDCKLVPWRKDETRSN